MRSIVFARSQLRPISRDCFCPSNAAASLLLSVYISDNTRKRSKIESFLSADLVVSSARELWKSLAFNAVTYTTTGRNIIGARYDR